MVENPPAKRDALQRLLDQGPAMLHLDPRVEGVVAPGDLRAGPVLRLKLSWHFAHPLSLDDEGVSQTLTFPSGACFCFVPWEAIFAMGPAERPPDWIWPSDLPPEMRDLLASAAQAEESMDVAVATAEPDPELDDAPEGDDPPGTIRRGHLRLIKS